MPRDGALRNMSALPAQLGFGGVSTGNMMSSSRRLPPLPIALTGMLVKVAALCAATSRE